MAFFVAKVPTWEGMAFLYLAADAYSEFVINLGIERDERDETVLKFMYLLTLNANIFFHWDKGFTLVADWCKKVVADTDAIIPPVYRELIVHKGFNTRLANPALGSL